MGQWIELDTPQGAVAAWQAEPPSSPKAGLVVVQEIFGVNAHIRDVADGYAAEGYAVLAPAFFDPVERGVELEYDSASSLRGRELVGRLGLDAALDIVASAAAHLRSRLAAVYQPKAVGTVGYCWGGTVAMLSALRLGLPSVSYYGARNLPFLEDPQLVARPRAPVMFHFGQHDPLIPDAAVQAHRQALPGMEVFTYPAGHAFNRDVDPHHFHAGSAVLARRRTLDFLLEHTS